MRPHASLRKPMADYIGGTWVEAAGGRVIESFNPARPEQCVYRGVATESHVDAAVAAARGAFPEWSRWGRARRFGVLRKFQEVATRRAGELAALLRDEVGKPLWDAQAEAGLIAGKVDITLDETPGAALQRVSGFETTVGPSRVGRAWFRPHGVMAVLGPFNFPAHLPNGHIVPALAMGNTVVFKPSDKAPASGQMLVEMLDEALTAEGAPKGVVNLVQGDGPVAAALSGHADIDGVLFTGSWQVGRRIMEANLDRPARMLALEMGGNNAALIMPDADLRQAVIECVRSAFITAGQRCTCTRRLVVHRSVADKVIPAVCKAASSLLMGDPASEHPVFMGPVIREAARAGILDAQRAMQRAGGDTLVLATAVDGAGRDGENARGWFVTPGVMQVERFVASEDGSAGADIEVFGPFLRIAIVDSLDEGIEQVNATRFGLAASIFTRDQGAIARFIEECRAGCVNVNTGTAGASSKLPFGGLGLSGNHRPAGAFSLDYCAYPVAGMIESKDAATVPPGMRFEDSWLG